MAIQQQSNSILNNGKSSCIFWGGYCAVFLCFLSSNLFSQPANLSIQSGHSDEICCLAFNKSGDLLASAGLDNTILIWDFKTRFQLKNFSGHSKRITSVHFLREKYILSSSLDGKLIIWDIESGKPLIEIKTEHEIVAAAISPDESKIVGCCNTDEILVWNIDKLLNNELDPQKIKLEEFLHLNFRMVQFTDEGNSILLVGGNKLVQISTPEHKLIRKAMLFDAEYLSAYPVSGDFVYISEGHKIIRKNIESSKVLFTRTSQFKKYYFSSIAINQDQTILAAGNIDHHIYLWKYNKGKFIRAFIAHEADVNCLVFHPQHANILLSGGKDQRIRIWDIEKQMCIATLESVMKPITSVSISDEGSKFLFANASNDIKLFDFRESLKFYNLPGHSRNVTTTSFLKGNDTFVSAGLDNRIIFQDQAQVLRNYKGNSNPIYINAVLNLPVLLGLTNFYSGYLFSKKYFLQNYEVITSMAVSADKKLSAYGGAGFHSGLFLNVFVPRLMPIHLYDNEKMKKYKTINAFYDSISSLAFSSDGTLIIASGIDYRTGSKRVSAAEIKKLNDFEFDIKKMPGKGKLKSINVHYEKYPALKIWDIASKKVIKSFEFPNPILQLVCNPLKNEIVFVDGKNNIVVFDYESNKTEKIAVGKVPLLMSPDGTKIYFQDDAFNMICYDYVSRKVSTVLSGHHDKITSAALSADGSRLITGAWDGMLKIWDMERGIEVVSIITIGNADYIVKTPDNYYFSTLCAQQKIGFTQGVKFYPFEQFDLKFNRPDIILEKMENADQSMIDVYKLAYMKRLKKMNFTEEMLESEFQLPEIKILNKQEIPEMTDMPVISLKLNAKDTLYNLDRINIWLNNVPLLGKNGINLRDFDTTIIKQDLTIDLAEGSNKIQVSVLNSRGVESLKETVELFCTKPIKKPDLYLVTIGVSEYKDQRFNLTYAAKDANDMINTFALNKHLFGQVCSMTLTDKRVTVNSLKEIREFLEKAGIDDIVIVFLAGHGILDKNFDYYFASYDMNFNDPEEKGISYDKIEALLDGIKAIKKILFMDTCHSGELDKDEIEEVTYAVAENGTIKFRAAGVGVRQKEGIGINNTSELVKELFTDLRRGTGSTVISSSGGAEYAMESKKWENGLFTFCILNGLNNMEADLNHDNQIYLSELQTFVRNKVSILSQGKQMPTSRVENTEMDFRIW